MGYAIIGFGKIGQALAHAFARKNIEVTVASRRSAEELAPQARLDPRSSPSRYWMHSRPTRSFWRSRSGNIVRLLRPCRVGKARPSSTR
jgi:NAD(P)-dependent dehydrogenase (short-subunit alcohol dehydrogenase family)